MSAPEKKEEIPFQMPSKKVLTEVQTVFQSVPNRPRKASATPLRVFSTVEKVLLMNSHTPEKICFTPSQAPCQSPVNTPTKTDSRPESMFSTTDRVLEIS